MTDAELLNLAEIILNEEEDCFVPVKKLAYLISEEKEGMEINIDKLEKLLQKDERFKVYGFEGAEEYWDEEDDLEMEQSGYFRGPRVMLLSRRPTSDDIVRMIEEKAQNALDALKKAYGSKDLTDEEENELLAVMLKTKELRDSIKDIGSDEE